ncbi:Protein RESTRICTED TEV MOVEMENT 3 [Raphanus sativus]|nr:Protein RESTRICTED TEV MOVEMENT 3 [Raphanus sativus]
MEKQSDKKITWMIKTFSSLQSEIVQSDIVVVGRCRWRLKAYPKGDNKAYHFSLYLGVADSEYLPLGWRRHAKFSLTVVNQFTEKLSQLGGDRFLIFHLIRRRSFIFVV